MAVSPREAAACLSGSVCQGPKGSASSRHGEEQRGPQCPWEFLPSCSGWGGFVPFVHASYVNMNLPSMGGQVPAPTCTGITWGGEGDLCTS